MNFTRNIHFTLVIRINKKLHEFYFRKRSPQEYDGDTGDDRGNRYYFKMLKEGDKWLLQGRNLPAWITENEAAITEELQKNDPV